MAMGGEDEETLALQIGRPLRALSSVIRRCDLGLPIVAAVPPVLDTGEPFPTRYWLTCPLAHRRIARLEAAGGVRHLQERMQRDPAFAALVASRHLSYAEERDRLIPGGRALRPSGGVGGSAGVKCLHAHYADYAAGNQNPIGRLVHDRVGEPHCVMPCVRRDGDRMERNPEWRAIRNTFDE